MLPYPVATLRLIIGEKDTNSVVEGERIYQRKIDKTKFMVIAEEKEEAVETVDAKIKRLIENECERVILEEKKLTRKAII